jgi:hypothetical protein
MHDLVHQVRAEVVYYAAPRLDLVLPAIGLRGVRAMAVEVGFEVDDAAEGTVLDIFGEGEEVGVPSTVLIDG